jgi:hypothetical protein
MKEGGSPDTNLYKHTPRLCQAFQDINKERKRVIQMKKTLAVLASFMLLICMMSAANAQGGSEGTTSTSILVQNLSTSIAQLRVDFYNTGGTNTGYKEATSLGSERTVTFDQRSSSGDPGTTPFQGAAIVSASQPIGAVVQEVRSGGSGGVNSYEAYNGLATAAQSVRAPLILRGISSAGKTWNTFMSIQNTSLSAVAHVTVVFSPSGLGTGTTASYNIPAGGSQYVMQKDQTALGTQFFGSATITSDQDVAVVVNSGTTDGSALIAYPTFTAGSTTVYLPGAMKNIVSEGNNYFTSLTIVNLGNPGDPAPIVSVLYQPKTGTATAAYNVTVSTATTIDQRVDSHITSSTFFGAVKLVSTNGTAIAAMLNTRGDTPGGVSKYATTYGGFATGVTTAYVPYLLKSINSAGYNWSTSILLQNLDPASGNLQATITYNEDPSIGSHTYNSPKTIATFDSVDLRYDANLTQATFYGGAKIVSTNSRPFGVVVLVRGSVGAGDSLSSYLGASQ